MRALISIAGLFLLAACTSPEEKAAQAAAFHAELEAQDDSQCQSYGAAPGSDQYFKCRMMIAQQRSAAAAQGEALMMQYMMNQPRYQPAQPYMLPTNPSVNCNTSYIGNQAYTHCN